jgi:hypothetical protein
MEGVIQRALGKSDVTEFVRFDLGAILGRESNLHSPKSPRFVGGFTMMIVLPLVVQCVCIHDKIILNVTSTDANTPNAAPWKRGVSLLKFQGANIRE